MAAAAENIRYHQIRSADKKGNGTQIQMFGGGSTSTGDVAEYDSGGNIIAVKGFYEIGPFINGKPAATEEVLAWSFRRTVIFPANFSGAGGNAGTNPTATATFTVKKNGSSVGTVVISTGGVFSFTTSGGAAVTFNLDDVMTIFAPSSQDATLSDVTFGLVGTR